MNTRSKHPGWFGLAGLVVGFAVDWFFWGKPFGISFLVWTALVLAGFFLLARGEKSRPSRLSLLLAAAILLPAFFTFLRQEVFTRFSSSLAVLGLLALLAATFKTGNWLYYRLSDHFLAGMYLVGACLGRPVELGRKGVAEGSEGDSGTAFGRVIFPALRGLLLAVPVVLVLGALLSSADPIFADWLEGLLKFLSIEKIPEYLFRLFYILVLAYLFTGALLHAILPRRAEARPQTDEPVLKPFLGAIESRTILLAVTALFAAFVVIQFRYLFGGQANISETGYTYSEYARRGFSELVLVAVLSLLLLFGLGTITRFSREAQKRGFTALGVLLVAEVLVMLASAWMRLGMYEDAYGFTRLRAYTHVFIPWLGALLFATLVLEVVNRRGRFALALLAACYGFTLTLGAVNIDGFIARMNIQRARQLYELDPYYLAFLTDDAVPAMAQGLLRGGLPVEARQRLGAELACRAAARTPAKDQAWQGFNLSGQMADRWLERSRPAWQEHSTFRDERGDWQVMIEGQPQPCQQGWMRLD